MTEPLHIIIPTYGRMPRQATLGYLPDSWAERTTLVVNEADAALAPLYRSSLRGARVLVHPPEIDTIAKKRAWIIHNTEWNKVVMFDDDLRFAVRRDQGTKLFQAEVQEINEHLQLLEQVLHHYIHAGWSARQGNNNHPGTHATAARQMFVLGYDTAALRQLEAEGAIKLGRVRTREDMELTIQLLKLGHANHVNFTIAADQVAGYAAKGGCSDERTVESSNADAEEFANLHPGLVKVVEKSYKGSVNRKEVVVSWKKAYQGAIRE